MTCTSLLVRLTLSFTDVAAAAVVARALSMMALVEHSVLAAFQQPIKSLDRLMAYFFLLPAVTYPMEGSAQAEEKGINSNHCGTCEIK